VDKLDHAYHSTRNALRDVLDAGVLNDPRGLQQVRAGLDQISHHKEAFGIERYEELEGLMAQVQQLPIRQSVFSPILTWNPYIKRIMCICFFALWLALLFSPVTILPSIIAITPGWLLVAGYLLPTGIAFMRGHNWIHILAINLRNL
jgi:hypothetical protein